MLTKYKFTHYCMWKIDSKRPDRIDINILHIAHACQLKVDGMHLWAIEELVEGLRLHTFPSISESQDSPESNLSIQDIHTHKISVKFIANILDRFWNEVQLLHVMTNTMT